MPELPEVETIKRGLQQYLIGHRIEKVNVLLSKIIHGDIQHVVDATVIDVRRFGKGLVIDLDNTYSLAIHIKLTGQIIYRDPDVDKKYPISSEKVKKLPNSATHVIFTLDNNAVLYYTDLRQFGWIKVVKTDELMKILFFKELGPEPFVTSSSGQAELTLEVFKKIVQNSNIPIKPLLLDQKKIAGVGNIYANDSLYDAKIDPRRKAKTLTDEEIEKLYDSLVKVLKKSMQYGGSSELNYVNALGQTGEYQMHRLVYGRQGEKCERCGSVIQKIQLVGRGTYFCPQCQR